MCGGVNSIHLSRDQHWVDGFECETRIPLITEPLSACEEGSVYCDLKFNDISTSVNLYSVSSLKDLLRYFEQKPLCELKHRSFHYTALQISNLLALTLLSAPSDRRGKRVLFNDPILPLDFMTSVVDERNTSIEYWWNFMDKGRAEVLWEKHVTVPLCPLQMPDGLERGAEQCKRTFLLPNVPRCP